jgi:hypothetical protein
MTGNERLHTYFIRRIVYEYYQVEAWNKKGALEVEKNNPSKIEVKSEKVVEVID